MKDIRARLEKLHLDAEDCLLVSKLATNPQKRELFEKLGEHYKKMAAELEAIIESKELPE